MRERLFGKSTKGEDALFQRITVLLPCGTFSVLRVAFDGFWTPVRGSTVQENAHIVNLQEVCQGDCVVGTSGTRERSESYHDGLVAIRRSQ